MDSENGCHGGLDRLWNRDVLVPTEYYMHKPVKNQSSYPIPYILAEIKFHKKKIIKSYFFGSPSWTRTSDPMINSHLLSSYDSYYTFVGQEEIDIYFRQ